MVDLGPRTGAHRSSYFTFSMGCSFAFLALLPAAFLSFAFTYHPPSWIQRGAALASAGLLLLGVVAAWRRQSGGRIDTHERGLRYRAGDIDAAWRWEDFCGYWMVEIAEPTSSAELGNAAVHAVLRIHHPRFSSASRQSTLIVRTKDGGAVTVDPSYRGQLALMERILDHVDPLLVAEALRTLEQGGTAVFGRPEWDVPPGLSCFELSADALRWEGEVLPLRDVRSATARNCYLTLSCAPVGGEPAIRPHIWAANAHALATTLSKLTNARARS